MKKEKVLKEPTDDVVVVVIIVVFVDGDAVVVCTSFKDIGKSFLKDDEGKGDSVFILDEN